MEKATIIGIDLAKRVFQLHGVTSDGRAAFRKRVSRGQLLSLLAEQPGAVVAMEACATAHWWGRAIELLGHEVRLDPAGLREAFCASPEERRCRCRSDR